MTRLIWIAALPMLLAGWAARAEEAANRPNYRTIETNKGSPPAGRQLYKTVDENGRTVYTDAPKSAGQKAAKVNAVNVESPEARRQTAIDLQNRRQEDYAERAAAARRNAPIQQRDYQEAQRKRREEEAQHPEYAPRPIRVVP